VIGKLVFACATCALSAYGDRSYNVAYIGLILTPFVVGLAVGAVITRAWWTARRDRTTDPFIDEGPKETK